METAKNHRDRYVALYRVVDRDDGGVRDIWMRKQQILDFFGIDVLSSTVEHVVGSTAEVEELGLVHVKKISGGEPPVLEPGRKSVDQRLHLPLNVRRKPLAVSIEDALYKGIRIIE